MSWPPFIIVVGSGGVGKTTLASALGFAAAEQGLKTLVMTFDPSLRLRDSLGVTPSGELEVEVPIETRGGLWASLLDARTTFDRLVRRYAPDEASRDRILDNPYYHHLRGSLAGILEYMAVERLFEVAEEGLYDQVILDTPPTKQALDFLEAPQRIVGFLDSGALKIAQRSWFDSAGRLRPAATLGPLGGRLESFLDEVVGLALLRDMVEFFQAFAPLFQGFRKRAIEVEELLSSRRTGFLLVAAPGSDPIPDTLFFARRLGQAGHKLLAIGVNRLHPEIASGVTAPGGSVAQGRRILERLSRRDHRGLSELRELAAGIPVGGVPLLEGEPSSLEEIRAVAELLVEALPVDFAAVRNNP